MRSSGRGEIEAWGRGIGRIFEACRKLGAPEPALRFEASGLWIEFPFSPVYLALIRGTPVETSVETSVETPTPADTSVETSVETPTPVETSVETSVKTPKALLDLLRENPQMTLTEVAAEIGRSVRAVEMASAKLVKAGKLRFVGPKKSGHWEVIP